jgi:DNA invertase Pin-like site-specific DNA recombinase
MIVGYARVSTADQDLAIQTTALMAAGVEKLFSEKQSGTSVAARAELASALDFMREGDTLVVTRIDRLARSVADLESIAATLRSKGVALRATEQAIDTSTPAGMAFFQMLGVFAQFETAIRKERQLEGIAKAKAAGVYKGAKTRIDPVRVREMLSEGQSPSKVAKALGISRQSVYRLTA